MPDNNYKISKIIDGKIDSISEYDKIGISPDIDKSLINYYDSHLIQVLDNTFRHDRRTLYIIITPIIGKNSFSITISRYYPEFNKIIGERRFRLSDNYFLSYSKTKSLPYQYSSFFNQLTTTPRLKEKNHALEIKINPLLKYNFSLTSTHKSILEKLIRGFLEQKTVLIFYPNIEKHKLHEAPEKIELYKEKMVTDIVEALDQLPQALKQVLTIQFNYVEKVLPNAVLVTAPESERVEKKVDGWEYPKLSFPTGTAYVSHIKDTIKPTETEEELLDYILKNDDEINVLFSDITDLKEGWITKGYVYEKIDEIKHKVKTKKYALQIDNDKLPRIEADIDYLNYLERQYAKTDNDAKKVLFVYHYRQLEDDLGYWDGHKEQLLALNSQKELPTFPDIFKRKLKELTQKALDQSNFIDFVDFSSLFQNIEDNSEKDIVQKTSIDFLMYKEESLFLKDQFLNALDFLKTKMSDHAKLSDFIKKNREHIVISEFINSHRTLLEYVPNKVYTAQLDSFETLNKWNNHIPKTKFNECVKCFFNNNSSFEILFKNMDQSLRLLKENDISPIDCQEFFNSPFKKKKIDKKQIVKVLNYTGRYDDFKFETNRVHNNKLLNIINSKSIEIKKNKALKQLDLTVADILKFSGKLSKTNKNLAIGISAISIGLIFTLVGTMIYSSSAKGNESALENENSELQRDLTEVKIELEDLKANIPKALKTITLNEDDLKALEVFILDSGLSNIGIADFSHLGSIKLDKEHTLRYNGKLYYVYETEELYIPTTTNNYINAETEILTNQLYDENRNTIMKLTSNIYRSSISELNSSNGRSTFKLKLLIEPPTNGQ